MKPRRLWRYEVTAVEGFGDRPRPPVEVGDIIVDRWRSPRWWEIYDLPRPGSSGMDYVGGWSARLLGEYDGPRDEKGLPVSVGHGSRASMLARVAGG